MNKKHLTTLSQIIICIACIMCLNFVQSCNSKSDYVKKPADTTQTFITLVLPLEWRNAGINGGEAVTLPSWRITKDTLIFDSTDANTLTKQWRRDTSYAIQVNLPKRDSITKQILYDSLKNVVYDKPQFPLLPKKYILFDYNSNPNKP